MTNILLWAAIKRLEALSLAPDIYEIAQTVRAVESLGSDDTLKRLSPHLGEEIEYTTSFPPEFDKTYKLDSELTISAEPPFVVNCFGAPFTNPLPVTNDYFTIVSVRKLICVDTYKEYKSQLNKTVESALASGLSTGQDLNFLSRAITQYPSDNNVERFKYMTVEGNGIGVKVKVLPLEAFGELILENL